MGRLYEDDYEPEDMRNSARFAQAKIEVSRFIQAVTLTNIGALGRRYPDWRDILVDVINDLRLEGLVNFDDHRPPPTPIQASRCVERIKFISRDMVKKNPHKAFLFGDNLARRGMGGQAKEMRGEPNAIGVPTKYFPTMNDDAFFKDEDFEMNKAHIDEAFRKVQSFQSVVVPADGIGTGLADLARRAPRTFSYLQEKMNNLWKIQV